MRYSRMARCGVSYVVSPQPLHERFVADAKSEDESVVVRGGQRLGGVGARHRVARPDVGDARGDDQ